MTVDLEERFKKLFTSGCDPYGVGATVLFDKPSITLEERHLVKLVFMHMAACRGYLAGESSLRSAADMFHEVGAAFAAEELLVDVRNAKLADSLRKNLRTCDQIKKIASDGFELCVRALAAMGAPDVTIHECGDQVLGEQPWNDRDEAVKCTGTIVHNEFTSCPVHDQGQSSDPMRCTGTRVHGEFTACPVHDWRDR